MRTHQQMSITPRRLAVGLTPLILAGSVASGQMNSGVQINTDADGRNIIGDAANEPSFAVSPIDPNVMVVGWRQFDTINSTTAGGRG